MRSPIASLPVLASATVALALALAPAAMAQQADSTAALPDLAPQDVEIRGRLEISLPSLERRPLTGLNPPPRVVELPDDRRPMLEPYRQPASELPPSPLPEPRSPSAVGLALGAPVGGDVMLAAGRRFDRHAAVRVGGRLGAGAYAGFRGAYHGRDTSTPFPANEGASDAFDRASAQAHAGTRVGHVRLAVDADAWYDARDLYGLADGRTGNIRNRTAEHAAVGAEAAYRGDGADARARVSFARDAFETTLDASGGGITSEHRATSDVLRGNASGRYALSGFRLAGALDVESASRAGAAANLTAAHAAGWVGFARRGVSLEAGLAVLRVNDDDARPSATFLAPRGRAVWSRDAWQVFAHQTPSAGLTTLGELLADNPFLSTRARAQAEIRTLDAAVGLRRYAGDLEITARVGAIAAPRFPAYAATRDASGTGVTVFAPEMLSAYQGLAALDIVGTVAHSVRLGAGGVVRDSWADGQGADDVPFVPAFEAYGDLVYGLADNGGHVRARMRWIGPRWSAFESDGGARLDGYADVDLDARYYVTPAIGLTAYAANLVSGATTRWLDHPEASLLIGAGLALRW